MTLTGRPSILFVCRDNSGLSLMAEAIAIAAHSHVRAFSAAVAETAPVDIAAVECLHYARIPADGLSSKPVELFGFSGAPRVDVVVAMVDEAHQALGRLAWHQIARMERWTFDDVSCLRDVNQRRISYRRLLPRLKAAVRAVVDRAAALPVAA
ncbi:hypothetical protein [Xanthobacter sp. KR7-225]|uniref:arsenate-mycothiol transferase ArsC n=1 Tax=Xanthobacter sp. KR7-225 TaxID=3156613 RepID=UPI0032B44AF0